MQPLEAQYNRTYNEISEIALAARESGRQIRLVFDAGFQLPEHVEEVVRDGHCAVSDADRGKITSGRAGVLAIPMEITFAPKTPGFHPSIFARNVVGRVRHYALV